jgi:predicted NBD/HSP70 family sugar kinase
VRQAGGARPGGPGIAKHTSDRAGARYREDGPVRQGSLREHNLALVLRHVAASPRPVSRAWIANATGLTRATVSALVDDLIGGRLLTEVEPAPRAGAGRPANGLTLAIDGPAGLGLEVNVDYLAACVVDLSGDVRLRLTQTGDQRPRTPDEVFADLAGLAAKARDAAVADGLRLAGAAVAVPGLVDPEGVVRLAPNLGWRDVPVPAALALLDNLADFAVALRVDNEANLAALGELHAHDRFGSARLAPRRDPEAAAPPGRPSFVYVSGEIGIGAGIVLDGALFRGARGWSGELGHMTVDHNGPPCHCGSRGCLERYAGQEVLLAATADGDADRLAELAAAGDRATLRALAGAATALGVTLAGVVNLLDVDTVVLGGVYAPLAPWLGPTVQKELRGRVLTAQWSPVTVRPSVLGGAAAVVGAAGSVVRSVLDQPNRWLTRLKPV